MKNKLIIAIAALLGIPQLLTWITITFGLRGSWKWAKRQMMKGHIVRCKHWSGTLKLKIDSKENTLLLQTHTKYNSAFSKWETSNHFLSYENFTDYVIVK